MRELVNRLASLPGVRLNPPASGGDIAAAETRFGRELPQEVSDFYALCDGMTFHECLDIPPLSQVISFFNDMASGPLFRMMFIILDEHESNPICLFHDGPLRGYVVRLFHDGDSYVGWRSFSALLEDAAAQLGRDGEADADKLVRELNHSSARTEHDVQAGHSMIEFATDTELDDADRPLAYGFAFDLLGDVQVAEIGAFLQHADMFVARAARNRLAQLQSPDAKAALEKYWAEVKRLVQHCAELLRRAGRNPTVVNEFDIRIDPGPIWLDWEALYSQKARSDFEPWVLGIGRRDVARQ
jgi:SMI1/KNR4 family protein SUKH-1